jgi:predicted enzyme related to lactoylglutathione lyase
MQPNMKTELGRITILVRDCDEAYEFYEKNLGCKKFFDLVDEKGRRYLHVGFNSELAAGIWLCEAETEEQMNCIGNQTAGKPVMVIYTDSLPQLYDKLVANGTRITREPVTINEQQFLQFTDLYGNEIVAAEKDSTS